MLLILVALQTIKVRYSVLFKLRMPALGKYPLQVQAVLLLLGGRDGLNCVPSSEFMLQQKSKVFFYKVMLCLFLFQSQSFLFLNFFF